jgi:chromosome segregation ATPase
VRSLVERYLGLRRENAGLERELEESRGRIAALDGEVFELNQRRQEVSKRIDELISQLQHLEAHFGPTGNG